MQDGNTEAGAIAGGQRDEARAAEPAGAGAAWQELAALEPMLRRYLRRRCRGVCDLDEVVQETLLRAARYRRGLSDDRRLRAWVLRIALNAVADHLRRRLRAPASFGEDFDPDLDLYTREGEGSECADEAPIRLGAWLLEREDALRLLSQELAQLRAEDRAVLDHYYQRALSCRETADACGIAPDLVKVHLFRARQRLLRAMRRRLSLTLGPAGGGRR
jgi:RNA polymerase sigma factor (sigma-70 family)